MKGAWASRAFRIIVHGVDAAADDGNSPVIATSRDGSEENIPYLAANRMAQRRIYPIVRRTWAVGVQLGQSRGAESGPAPGASDGRLTVPSRISRENSQSYQRQMEAVTEAKATTIISRFFGQLGL